MGRPGTPEQLDILDAFAAGNHLIVTARAGTGKTSTLRAAGWCRSQGRHARWNPQGRGRRGIYFTYNRAAADDASKTFERNVDCRTAHSLAYRAMVTPQMKARLDASQRLGTWDTVRALQLDKLRLSDQRILGPDQVARVVMETVTQFSRSADPIPMARHVPPMIGVDDDETARRALVAAITPLAVRAWEDLRVANGRLRLTLDHVLKMWQLTRPRLGVDFLFLDEAQDANPVIEAIFRSQEGYGAQLVAVGDQCQAINRWNGAVDAMARMPGTRLALTQSFRFGAQVAAEANRWLHLLDAGDLPVRGNPAIQDRIGRIDTPDAVLCRTNATAVQELLRGLDAGIPTALVGPMREIRAFVEGAEQLKRTGSTSHRDLIAFSSWWQVQQYVSEAFDGDELRVYVDLIDEYDTTELLAALDASVDESRAALVISTAHKSKGREWAKIRIADDFDPRHDDDEPLDPDADDKMLAYVAVTRCKTDLDRGGLRWIDDYAPPAPRTTRVVCVR